YLIGADLKRYLEPWAHARLNAVERCLLAQRIAGEAPATARHLRELWELLPPRPDEKDRLFETALRGRALSEAEETSFRADEGMGGEQLLQAAARAAERRARDGQRLLARLRGVGWQDAVPQRARHRGEPQLYRDDARARRARSAVRGREAHNENRRRCVHAHG